jgi:predicted deacylase
VEPFVLFGQAVAPGSRAVLRRSVASLLVGGPLALVAHVVHGRSPGPVLGLVCGVHGPEHLPVWGVREALRDLSPEELRGTVVAVPVANPLAFAQGSRVTLEDDVDFGNLNRVFPGRRAHAVFGAGPSEPSDRSLTERVAEVLAEEVLPHLTHLLDFHTHFHGVGLAKTIVGTDGGSVAAAVELAYAFGLPLVQRESVRPHTCTGYATSLGVVAIAPEFGGDQLPLAAARRCVEVLVRGIRRVMAHLGMTDGPPVEPGRFCLFSHVPHVRPNAAGYLVPRIDPVDVLCADPPGVWVRAGDLLAELFDPYTFEVVETLRAPADGLVYMARRPGPVEAGAHAFAVAAEEGSRWVFWPPKTT